MTNITPPPELVTSLRYEAPTGDLTSRELSLITAAYRAGADMELEACCEWLSTGPYRFSIATCWSALISTLRVARRPKPLSLKKQALADLNSMSIEPCLVNGIDVNAPVRAKYNNILRALKALPDDD